MVHRINDRLRELIADSGPEGKLAKQIVGYLERLPTAALELMAPELGVKQKFFVDHERLRNYYRVQLAFRTVRYSEESGAAESAAAAFCQVTSFLQMDDALKIIRWLVPFWVDRSAAQQLRTTVMSAHPKDSSSVPPAPKPVVAINGAKFAGDCYLRRARCDPVPWQMVTIDGVVGQNPEQQIAKKVVSAFAHKWKTTDEERVADRLRDLDGREPHFVLLYPGLDHPTVDRLRRRFENLTFFVLCGDPSDDDPNISWEVLTPRLARGKEGAAKESAQRAAQTIRDSYASAEEDFDYG